MTHLEKLTGRSGGRADNGLRPTKITYDPYGYATASVLFEMGNTKVLCSAHLVSGVPPFLKGKKTGWLKAEYAMLPSATASRTTRESTLQERNGRSVEISRLIGRVLRTSIDFVALGEQTIIIDCDVLQADGGTRAASITGASLALIRAMERWVDRGLLAKNCLLESIAAISLGVSNSQILLDIDFQEDSHIDADFTLVFAQSGSLVEIQGTAEKKALSWEQFNELCLAARQGIEQLFMLFPQQQTMKIPMFSLEGRLQHGK